MFFKGSKVQVGQSFSKSAAILSIAIVGVKVINFIYKTFVGRIIESNGASYFGSSYSLYTVLYAIAGAGLPTAISKMVSVNYRNRRFNNVRQIHKISTYLLVFTGIIGTVLMLIGAFAYPHLINVQKNNLANELYYVCPMLALVPTVFFYCMMSAYRGYYTGLRNTYPSAISEVVEALGKLAIGLPLAYFIFNNMSNSYQSTGKIFGQICDPEKASYIIASTSAAGAVMGTTFGSILGYIFLLLRHKIFGDGITKEALRNSPPAEPDYKITRALIKIAVPVAVGALVLNISDFIDTLLIQRQLRHLMQTAIYDLKHMYENFLLEKNVIVSTLPGHLHGCYVLACNLMMLIPSLTIAFGITAIPVISSIWGKDNNKKIKRQMESIIKVVTLVSFSAGLFVFLMGKYISQFMYLKSSNAEEVEIISKCLPILGLAGMLLAIASPIFSLLQAIGRVDLPVKLLGLGVIIKIILNYILVGIPNINIYGAGMGSLFCYLTVAIGAFLFLKRETKLEFNVLTIFLKPFLAALSFALGAKVFYIVLSLIIKSNRVNLIMSTLFSSVIFVFCVLWMKIIRRSDLKKFPKGEKLLKIKIVKRLIG